MECKKMENKIKKLKQLNIPTLSVIAFVISFAILMQISHFESAHALTKYFACIVDKANEQGSLSIGDADACYVKEFKGAADADNDGFPMK
jgi:hypothetical protein